MTYRSKMPPETVCIPQIYEDDDGRWWRVCITCDDGSNKFGRNPRGHATRADAEMSFRDHAVQIYKNRQAWQCYREWKTKLCAATTYTEFITLWYNRHPQYRPTPFPPEETPARIELMHEIQERMRSETVG